MKKQVIMLFTVLAILTMLFSTAAAPAKTATFVGADWVQGKGLVLTFNVSGKFSNADLKGSFYVYGERSYNMDCQYKDNTNNSVVACVVPDAVRKFMGKGAVARFGELGFYVDIPEPEYFCNQWDLTYVRYTVTFANGLVLDDVWWARGFKSYQEAEHLIKRWYYANYGYNNIVDVDVNFMGCNVP